jgi:cytochrome c oxidase subunit II
MLFCALRTNEGGLGPGAIDIMVIGHQWCWEARYTNSDVVVANGIHVPVGKPPAMRLDAADVLHEFWVPELARKITTVPGYPNHICSHALLATIGMYF